MLVHGHATISSKFDLVSSMVNVICVCRYSACNIAQLNVAYACIHTLRFSFVMPWATVLKNYEAAAVKNQHQSMETPADGLNY